MIEITPQIEDICRRIAALYKEQLKSDGAYATGTLYDSVDNFDIVSQDNTFELYFNLPTYFKYSPESTFEPKVPRASGEHPYKDAHPSRAMIDSLSKWIEAKNLTLNPYAVGKKILVDGWKNEPRENFKKFLESLSFEEAVEALMEAITDQQEDIIDKLIDNLL